MIVFFFDRKPSTSFALLARTLRSRVRGESTLKRLVIGADSRSSDASCEALLSLLSIFTFVDSPTVMGTSTKGETKTIQIHVPEHGTNLH